MFWSLPDHFSINMNDSPGNSNPMLKKDYQQIPNRYGEKLSWISKNIKIYDFSKFTNTNFQLNWQKQWFFMTSYWACSLKDFPTSWRENVSGNK